MDKEYRKYLTAAQVVKAVKMGVIFKDAGKLYLSELGYDPADIEVMFKISKVDKAQRELPLDEPAKTKKGEK